MLYWLKAKTDNCNNESQHKTKGKARSREPMDEGWSL